MIQIKNFINGQFIDALSGSLLNTINPATNKIIATLPDSDENDIELAYQAAIQAFPAWSALSPEQRSVYLYKLADLIEKNLDSLAECESLDQGKPKSLAKRMDIPRAIDNFRFFAGAILHEQSEFFNSKANTFNYSLRQPYGVVGLISPWNLPLYLLTWKIAPAIATGNTCIAKPSEITPLTAFKLSELVKESGIPDGVINIVHGLGPKAGHTLTSHPNIPLISFTGGTQTGRFVYQNAISTFKKVSLELGGKNPSILFADANYEQALTGITAASFTNQGEICLCGSRIFVEESIYQKFITDFVKKVNLLKIGDPLNTDTDMGAIASEAHFKKVLNYIELAKTDGAKIETGGARAQLDGNLKDGFFILPTILTGLDYLCRVNQEEIFGPVVTVTPFKTEQDLLKMVNSTQYGLAANLWTSNLERTHKLSAQIDCGIIWVNTWLNRDLRTAFGGMRESGIGREGGRYSLEFFTKVKNICVQY
jgi:aminomuconate-semialdehyde/2-hydroxymuconate-6-semialdehyde dehydrogenase